MSATTTSAAGTGGAWPRSTTGWLVFLDKSAVNTAMTPTHGRSPRGERVVDSVPRSYGEQTSLIGALSFGRGLVAVMTLTGAVVTLAFDAYLLRVLAPRLRKGDVVGARQPQRPQGEPG